MPGSALPPPPGISPEQLVSLCAGVAAGNATLLGDGNGASTYYVSPPSTQFFTLGNGGIIQYGDGVTPESPKAYNNFTDVM